ncbi:MAG: hypothetical protein HQK60_07865 [Deltaproteobacteria bacterium]|nr:hypothetical protein [Deltaproteobacteria bacterium]
MQDYEKQWPGLDIKHLVISTDSFIVWVDPELDVDWATNDSFDKDGPKDEAAHHQILNRAASIECIPIEHISETVRLSFKRMLGEGIARSLEHDYENAKKMLDSAEAFIQARNGELARSWYLSGSFRTAGLAIIAGLVLWLIRDYAVPFLGQTLFDLMIASVAGATGALLSVIMRMGDATLDSAAGRNMHLLESASRIVAGMISAIVVASAIKADLIFPIFSKLSCPQVAIVLAGLVAGSSERLAPSIIRKIESKTEDTDKKPEE